MRPSKTVVVFALLLSVLILPAFGQTGFQSHYPFDGSVADQSGAHDLTLVGSGTFDGLQDDQTLVLTGESYLDAPLTLSTAIRSDESFYVSIDFNMSEEGIDESARILIGNKTWDYSEAGFQFALLNEKTEWQPDGVAFINFNIGGGGNGGEIAGRFYDIPMGEWHTASFFVDFQAMTVTFGLNGRSSTQSLLENIDGSTFDPQPFLESLSTQPIRIGGPAANLGTETIVWELFGSTTTDHVAELQLNNLSVSSPRAAGSSSVANAALQGLTGHLDGTALLTDDAVSDLHESLRQNLHGVAFSDIDEAMRAFIAAHNANREPLYVPVEWDMRRYDNFPAASQAYIDAGLWMLRGGVTSTSAELAVGITFQEHELFPGVVDPAAERVNAGTAAINAYYVKDPYYTMGDMQVNEANELSSYVFRPTGFWAPAGEVVEVTLPQSAVDSGLHIRVGGHKYDHTLFVDTNRFPLLHADFRVDETTTTVINPLGGGVYVLVPMGVDLGWIDIQVDGAVRAPYFSTREGHETDLSDWPTIRNYPAPLADFESDNYWLSVPADAMLNLDDPSLVLNAWDEALAVLQLVHGRPAQRVRAEGFMFDTRTSVLGSYPGGYPVTPGLWSQINEDIKQGSFSPFAMVSDDVWETDEGLSVLFHEMSHHHFGYSLEYERETWVNVPFAAVLNTVLGKDLDYALKYSTYQRFTRDDAAIDWMVTTNFRTGQPIGIDPTTDFQPEELAYQSRGSAKYIDLADIFDGWDALGAIHKTFYDEDVATGVPVTYTSQEEVSRDHFLKNGSEVLGCNLLSLFQFWGIHASETIELELAPLPSCDGAEQRIRQYMSVAPRSNEELWAFYTEKTAVDPFQLKPQIYQPLLETFDVTEGQQIRDMGASLLLQYFEVEPDEPPTKPQLLTTDFSVSDAATLISFEWTPSMDPESEPLTYSWRLVDGTTGEPLVSRSYVSGTSVEVPTSELMDALSRYDASVDFERLAQIVTTSDTFTIVSSDSLYSFYQNGISTDTDEAELPQEFVLEPAYPNPFNPSTTVSFSLPEAAPVTLEVVDMLGRRIAALLGGEILAGGRHEVRFDASNFGSGPYMIRLTSGSRIASQMVFLLK